MNYPKISIVTPSYNQKDYLEQTIRSVIDQNYPNLEYVVMDGGSTDGSADVIRKYADRISYWVSEKDKGQYDAINKGFAHTTGEIMGWINSSDLLYPWTLHIVGEIFEQNPHISWIHGLPSNMSHGTAPQSVYNAPEKNIFDVLSGNYAGIQQESCFWRRSLWEKAGGALDINIRYAGDFNLWLKFFEHAELYYVNTILGGFRFHDVRRGGYSTDHYGNEVKAVFKEYRGKASAAQKMKAMTIKTLVGKSDMRSRALKKLKLFPWYRRRLIMYDFEKNRWVG